MAVVSVILAHIALYQASGRGHITGGFIGVDVFFVLSGYLITQLLLREADRAKRVSIRGFYARRARRILPAATVVLVAVVAYSAWRLPDVQRSQFSSDAGWSATFLANWHFASAGVDYFDTSTLSPLQHFWSLAVEEQFYIIWPLLIGLLAPRMRRAWLGGVVGLICLASLGWSIYVTSYAGLISEHEAYFSSFARAYELGIGALVAVTMPQLSSSLARTALAVLGLGTIVAGVVLLPANAPFPGWQALIPCVGTAALLIAGEGGVTIVGRALSLAPMRFLGNISYSAYLWHFPIIVLAGTLFPHDWSLRRLVVVELLVMLILSTISYYVIESPWRSGKLGNLIRNNRALVLWPLALVMVFGTIAGGSSYAAHRQAERARDDARWFAQTQLPLSATGLHGTPLQQVQQQLTASIELANAGAPFTPDLHMKDISDMQPGPGYMCFAQNGESQLPTPCIYGDKAASRVVALVGDSHAGMLIPALDKFGQREHFKVVMYQKLGCGPYDVEQYNGTYRQQCDEFRVWTMNQLRNDKPDVVVVFGQAYLDIHPATGQTLASAWQAGVDSAVKRFRSVGARVLVVGDVPARGSLPATCIETHRRARDCMIAPTSAQSTVNSITKNGALKGGADYVAMQPFVCVADKCPLIVGQRVLYWDVSHLTRAWIDHVTPAIEEVFAPYLLPHQG